MIVATAGHIDHGKTALVQALTQTDTDRLAEEKRRGMSIDLGFAYADFGGELPLGFIDVPGHERFIRNMLAGVAAVDYALLVIAADDGPMPQTREHLAVLDLLGITRGAVALTKIDRTDPRRLESVREEIQALLGPTSLAAAPVFPVSSLTGAGLPELRSELVQAVQSHRASEPSGHFRLAVDRGFTIRGAGWVVTGTALSGSVQVGDRVATSPGGLAARVRAIHVHKAPADMARAGERCALNLSGDLKHQPVERGDWLVAPALHQPSARLDVSLRLSAATSRALGHWSSVQLHLGAAARNARVALLEGPTLAPGATGLAQLVLDSPVHAAAGDRFILRDPAAQRILAGGRIIEPFGARRGRAKPERLALLRQLDQDASPESALAALLAGSPQGVALGEFARAFNVTPTELEPLLSTLDVITVSAPSGPLGLRREHWQTLSRALLDRVDGWHRENPDSLGLSEAELGQLNGTRLAPPVRRALLTYLIRQGALARSGFSIHRPGHRPRLGAADQEQLDAITAILEKAGLRPPIVGELAAALGVEKAELLVFLERVQALGHLLRVAPNRYFLPETVGALARIAADLAEESAHGDFDAAQFRDRSGIGRNLSIQVLEYLDRAGVTRFANEKRRLQSPEPPVVPPGLDPISAKSAEFDA